MSQKLIELAEANSNKGVTVNDNSVYFDIFPVGDGLRFFYNTKDYFFKGFLKGQDNLNPAAKGIIGFWVENKF